MAKQTFKKIEKLNNVKLMEQLFAEGTVIQSGALRLIYLYQADKEIDKALPPVQAAFAVSKRNFKKAVDRNYIKRVMRECYRKEKAELYDFVKTHQLQLPIVWMYTSKKMPDYAFVEKKMKELLLTFVTNLKPPID